MCRSCERESAIDTEPEWIPLSPKGRGETASKPLESQVSIGVETFVVAPLEATLSLSLIHIASSIINRATSVGSLTQFRFCNYAYCVAFIPSIDFRFGVFCFAEVSCKFVSAK